MEIEDLKRLKSYAYANTDAELGDKVQEEIDLLEEKELLEEEINSLYKSGYNYLDIAKQFREKGNHVIISDDIFIVYIKSFVILFEHSTYDIKI